MIAVLIAQYDDDENVEYADWFSLEGKILPHNGPEKDIKPFDGEASPLEFWGISVVYTLYFSHT